jgi:hypothetical protein
VLLQSRNHALKLSKSLIIKETPPKSWTNKCLHQFKLNNTVDRSLLVIDDFLFKNIADNFVPVITFRLLVGVVYKTHQQLAHIG